MQDAMTNQSMARKGKAVVTRSMALLAAMMAMLLAMTSPAMAQEVPFDAVITEDDVILRAGAGTPYYVVGQAGQGVRVTVTERIADWYKITPPPSTYSYVSKAFVEVRGDGSTGTVRQRVPAYAASINGPGESYRRQLDLLAGDVVRIVGEDGSYFKIQPPKGAYVYVQTHYIASADTVATPAPEAPPEAPKTPETPATPAASETPQTPAAPAPQAPESPEAPEPPAAPEVPQTTTPEPPATPEVPATPEAPAVPQATIPEPPAAPQTPATPQTPASPASPDSAAATDAAAQATQPDAQAGADDQPADAASTPATPAEEPRPTVVAASLAAVEEQYALARRQPIEQQPLEDFQRQYQSLQQDDSLTPGDQRVVVARLAQISRNITLAKAIKDLKAVRRDLQPSTTILVPPPTARRPADYDAVGQLLASSVYDGTALPRLYRLVAAGEGRTIAYVRPSAAFDPAQALGSQVGIVGTTRYDTALKLRVIDVQQIDILRPADGDSPSSTTE